MKEKGRGGLGASSGQVVEGDDLQRHPNLDTKVALELGQSVGSACLPTSCVEGEIAIAELQNRSDPLASPHRQRQRENVSLSRTTAWVDSGLVPQESLGPAAQTSSIIHDLEQKLIAEFG